MNIRYLSEIKPDGSKASIELLGKYASNSGEIIEDPYFVGPFFRVFLYIKCLFFRIRE